MRLNENIKELLFIVGCFTMALLMILLLRSRPERWPTYKETSDTVTTKTAKTKTDTFFVDRPVPVKDTVLKYVKVAAEPRHTEQVAQTENERDSVVLPITQKEYQDSTYHAWVSGYNPVLDSIRVYQKERTVTVTNFVTKEVTKTVTKTRPLSIGLQGGYGYGIVSKRFEPYIGIGFSLGL